MPEQTDLHLVLSRELQTDDLSLERDTTVVTPELTEQVTIALTAAALSASSGRTPLADLARARL